MVNPATENLRYMDVRNVRPVKNSELPAAERAVLEEVKKAIAAAPSLDEMLHKLVELTKDICSCDRIGLAFIEESGKRVVAHRAITNYEPVLLKQGYSEDLAGSSLQMVLDSGRPRIIGNLEYYLKQHPESHSTRLIVQEGIRSSMTCPLYVEDRIIGFLFRSSRSYSAYGTREIARHMEISQQLSSVVEKAYRIEQLTRANADYMEMLGFVSHELKNPLASIIMDARLITQGYLGPVPEKPAQKVQQIIRKSEYLMTLIRDYLNLARIESDKLDVNLQGNVDFCKDVLGYCLSILDSQIREHDIKLKQKLPGQPLLIECDPDLLRIVMMNLLSNAVKYSFEGAAVRLEVALRDGQLYVSVWNEGPGFEPEMRTKLFRKFSRLKTPGLLRKKGTGLGLYTSWRIINMHNGTIQAESEPGKWARFYFSIPQPVNKQATNDHQ